MRSLRILQGEQEKVIAWCDDLAGDGYAPSTIYSMVSAVKKMYLVHHGVESCNWGLLKAWLKNNAKGYEPCRAPTFVIQDVMEFVKKASDKKFINEKLALLFGWFTRFRGGDYPLLTHDMIGELTGSTHLTY